VKRKLNASQHPQAADTPPGIRHVVITVHGIRTFGGWQERLRNLLLARDPGVEVLTYKYGYFSSLAFLIPPLRWLATRHFRGAFLQVAHQFPGARIDIVAHSFGTHLVGWGLRGIPRANRPSVHTIILAGSVLHPGFPWGTMFDDGTVHRVMNECGINDWILVLNQLVVLFTGMAGRLGFTGMTSGRFGNNWYHFGHSDYFLRNGVPDDGFMAQRWAPVLLSDELAPPVDERTGSAWQGLLTFVLQNSEPIKVVVYAAPFVALTLIYYHLFTSEREARQLALARQLAAQAELLRTHDPRLLERSTLLAIEAIRRLHSVETDQALRGNLDILPRQRTLLKHSHQVTMLALSRDRRLLAASSTDNVVRVWEFPLGRTIASLGHSAQVISMAFSVEKRLIATGTWAGQVVLWELPSGGKWRWHDFKGRIDALEFGPDGRHVLVSAETGAWLWSLGPEPSLRMLTSGGVFKATFRADSRFVATARPKDDYIRIWDVQKAALALQLPTPVAPHDLAFSPNGRYLAVASGYFNEKKTNAIWLWDVQGPRRVARIPQGGYVTALSFSPPGDLLATAADDGFARVWRTESGEAAGAVTHGAPYAIRSVAWSPGGEHLATAGTDHTARVWDLRSGREVARMVHGDWVNVVLFGPDPPYLITASGCPDAYAISPGLDRSVRVWGMPLSTERARLEHPEGAHTVAFAPNGRMIATGSDDGLVRFFGVPSGEALPTLDHGSAVADIAFGPRGEWLVTASERRMFPKPQDDLIRLWDTRSHKELLRIPTADLVRSVAVSPDGRYLVSGGGGGIMPKAKDTSVHVWEIHRPPEDDPWRARSVATLPASSDVLDVAFGPDGKLGVSVERSGILTLWRTDSGAEVGRLDIGIQTQEAAFDRSGSRLAIAALESARIYDVPGLREVQRIPHDSFVNSVAFSPDGRYLATGDSGKSAHVWDLRTNREVARFTHDNSVSKVVFSPDGRLLATAGSDKAVRLWLWRREDLIAEACRRLTRDLTKEEWRQYLVAETQHPTCPRAP
jgi:WD40 repeat protein